MDTISSRRNILSKYFLHTLNVCWRSPKKTQMCVVLFIYCCLAFYFVLKRKESIQNCCVRSHFSHGIVLRQLSKGFAFRLATSRSLELKVTEKNHNLTLFALLIVSRNLHSQYAVVRYNKI